LQEATGWRIVAHNRYWSANTDYATQNGGAYPFYIDKAGSAAGGQMAVPLTADFWEFLLTSSQKECELLRQSLLSHSF
jgi:hypothetical protein